MTIEGILTGKHPVTDEVYTDLDTHLKPCMELRIEEPERCGKANGNCMLSLAVPPELKPLADHLEVGSAYSFVAVGTRMPNGQFINILFLAGLNAFLTEISDDWHELRTGATPAAR